MKATIKIPTKIRIKLKGRGVGECPIITNIDGGEDPASVPSTINGLLNGGEI